MADEDITSARPPTPTLIDNGEGSSRSAQIRINTIGPVMQPQPRYGRPALHSSPLLPTFSDHQAAFPQGIQEELLLYNPLSSDINYANECNESIARSPFNIFITNLLHHEVLGASYNALVYYDVPCNYCILAKGPWENPEPCFDPFTHLHSQRAVIDVVALIKWETTEIFARESWRAAPMTLDGGWKFAAVYSKVKKKRTRGTGTDGLLEYFCWCRKPPDVAIYVEDLDLTKFTVHGDLGVEIPAKEERRDDRGESAGDSSNIITH